MDILAKLLGNQARVKIMRLFLSNKSKAFTPLDVAKRSRVAIDSVRREIRLLSSVGFVKKRNDDWYFDMNFRYANEFESLLIKSDTFEHNVILDMFKKVGKLKFMVISGFFIKDKESRVDLLLVGDKLNKSKIEDNIKKMEAEIGKELVYAVFETKDFIYRLNMYDKLVRDILDFPHEIILQAKELSTQILKKL
ncbi:hypothetical protein K8Q94_01850 [Candidatus Nomurabacteria bacterium]|nr:hypothetical protein [Candidatus Nomurabacteria bacterium]